MLGVLQRGFDVFFEVGGVTAVHVHVCVSVYVRAMWLIRDVSSGEERSVTENHRAGRRDTSHQHQPPTYRGAEGKRGDTCERVSVCACARAWLSLAWGEIYPHPLSRFS